LDDYESSCKVNRDSEIVRGFDTQDKSEKRFSHGFNPCFSQGYCLRYRSIYATGSAVVWVCFRGAMETISGVISGICLMVQTPFFHSVSNRRTAVQFSGHESFHLASRIAHAGPITVFVVSRRLPEQVGGSGWQRLVSIGAVG